VKSVDSTVQFRVRCDANLAYYDLRICFRCFSELSNGQELGDYFRKHFCNKLHCENGILVVSSTGYFVFSTLFALPSEEGSSNFVFMFRINYIKSSSFHLMGSVD
jgi:hypothetical protein